jgi:hypothetical protein
VQPYLLLLLRKKETVPYAEVVKVALVAAVLAAGAECEWVAE